MDKVEIIYGVVIALISGSIGAVVNGIFQSRKVKAEAESIGAKTQPEIEELTVGTMSEVVRSVHEDNRSLREERDYYRERLLEVEKRVEFLTGELAKLQNEIAQLLQQEASNAVGTQHTQA